MSETSFTPGTHGALRRYIQSHREQLGEELAHIRASTEAEACSIYHVPQDNAAWLAWLAENSEKFAEKVRTATRERRIVSHRIEAVDSEFLADPRLLPARAPLSTVTSQVVGHGALGFFALVFEGRAVATFFAAALGKQAFGLLFDERVTAGVCEVAYRGSSLCDKVRPHGQVSGTVAINHGSTHALCHGS